MSITAVRTPAEYEAELQRYLFERAEEGRAVRVGEKEVSERAEIVARYRDLFTREQLDALKDAETGLNGSDRERVYRLRKTCEAGLVDIELSEREDAFENAVLAKQIEFQDEEMTLRSAQADPVVRNEEEKGISLRELSEVLGDTSTAANDVYRVLSSRWFDKLLGDERPETPTSYHVGWMRRLSPLAATYTK